MYVHSIPTRPCWTALIADPLTRLAMRADGVTEASLWLLLWMVSSGRWYGSQCAANDNHAGPRRSAIRELSPR